MTRFLLTLTLLWCATTALAVQIKNLAVDQTVDIFIQDSAATDGSGKTGIASGTAGLTCYYREGATGAMTALTLTDDGTPAVADAHADGNFIEVDATNAPGVYRLDLSDTMVNGGSFVTIYLQGAAGMAPVVLRVDLVPVPVDLMEIGGVSQSATDLKDFADAGYDPTANKVQGVVLTDTATDLTNLPTIPANWITAAGIATDAIGDDEVASLTNTSFAFVDANERVDVGSWLGTAVATPGTAGVPSVDVIKWNTAAISDSLITLAEINTEVDTALNTAIPASPTADSINERIKAIDDLTQASGGGDLAAILTDTAHIDTYMPATGPIASSGEVDTLEASMAAIKGASFDTSTDSLEAARNNVGTAGAGLTALPGMISGASATGTLSTTVSTSDLSGYADNELIGRIIAWTGGTASGQASIIVDYASANGTVTYRAITTAPVNGDAFVIIGGPVDLGSVNKTELQGDGNAIPWGPK